MSWPTATDYIEAMQHTSRRFCKPELQRSQVTLDRHGKALVRPGKSVDVYELRSSGGVDRWAVGCFTQEPTALAQRWQIINDHLRLRPVPSLVESEYLEQGICIRGRWYPITRSRWIDGLPLNAYVRDYIDHPDELRLLADVWLRLADELRQAGMAHGNLASDTVLVASASGGALTMRLVDYDGIYVPALGQLPPTEMGHADYQHPQRLGRHYYNAEVDRFAQLVVTTALHAAAVGGRALWDRFDNGANLLFSYSDFQEPATSPLFRELWALDSTRVTALTGLLILACHGALAEVLPIESTTAYLRPGPKRSTLTAQEIDRVNSLMDMAGGRRQRAAATNMLGVPAPRTATESCLLQTPASDDFVLEVEDEPACTTVDTLVAGEAISTATPPLAILVPSAAPRALLAHPLAKTFQFDAWMPEQVAVVKLQGFIKDVGGEVQSSVPGSIRVNLLDEQDLAQMPAAGFLAWLGLVQPPPQAPRVVAEMELNLVHKPTPTRTLIGITLSLAPAVDDTEVPNWYAYCDRIFCELRGYLMGYL